MGFLKPAAQVGTFGLTGLAATNKKKKPQATTTPRPSLASSQTGQKSLIDLRPQIY